MRLVLIIDAFYLLSNMMVRRTGAVAIIFALNRPLCVTISLGNGGGGAVAARRRHGYRG